MAYDVPRKPDGSVDWPLMLWTMRGRVGKDFFDVSREIGCCRNTVDRLLNKKGANPRFDLGERIIEVYHRVQEAR